MLMSNSNIKCAFFHSEEWGCIGSSAADMDWFKDVGYCFQADRRGAFDFINNIFSNLYSKKFSKRISPILKHYGYSEKSGSITDVGQLAENGIGVCVANMSCGYYNPHTDEEIVEFYDSNNCLDMISMLVAELGCSKYEYKQESSRKKSNYKNDLAGDSWGDFRGSNKNYWYGDYGTASSEIMLNDDGEETCYYCGNSDLAKSEFTDDEYECRWCPDCESDLLVEKRAEKSQNQIARELEAEDISDTYSGSLEHRQIVNNYLQDYHNKKQNKNK